MKMKRRLGATVEIRNYKSMRLMLLLLAQTSTETIEKRAGAKIVEVLRDYKHINNFKTCLNKLIDRMNWVGF
jgi:hypothetical protein